MTDLEIKNSVRHVLQAVAVDDARGLEAGVGHDHQVLLLLTEQAQQVVLRGKGGGHTEQGHDEQLSH